MNIAKLIRGLLPARTRLALSLLAVVLLAVVPGHPLLAAVPDKALRELVDAAAFEVVLPKAKDEGITYERPLPLDLVPFKERTDAYVSIGSAFAIGANRFVTASHVLSVSVGSLTGPPAIRDASGKIYAIDQVLQFSLSEDYAVFTVADAPTWLRPLPTNSHFVLNEAVYAAGNALGQGVIVRDGMLTSTTPEAVAGRWDWLRFSAAASPGNSGGPLLDASGSVLGVIVAKSPNENLNFALPIQRVLDGDTKQGTLESMAVFRVPVMGSSTVIHSTMTIPLPLQFAAFSDALIRLAADYYRDSESQYLAEHGAGLFPHGDTADLLAAPDEDLNPSMLLLHEGDIWGHAAVALPRSAPLPRNGNVVAWANPNVALFRIRSPDGTLIGSQLGDTKALLDTLLKAMPLQRKVGPESVRITSIGPAVRSSDFNDAYGRVWRVLRWDVPQLQTAIVAYVLPTPDGFVGMILSATPSLAESITMRLATLTRFFTVSYSGTLGQWEAFLAQNSLRPKPLIGVVVGAQHGEFAFGSPRFDVTVPSGILEIGERSVFELYMGFVQHSADLVWQPVGVAISGDADFDDRVIVLRYAKPAATVQREAQTRWMQMTGRSGDYTGTPRQDSASGESWVVAVAPGDGDRDLYVVDYSTLATVDTVTMGRRRDALLKGLKVSSDAGN